MNFTCVFFGILFCIAGVMFVCGKGHNYMSAWKAMPEEEKKKIKIIPLCRNIGSIIVLNGAIFLLKGFLRGFSEQLFVFAMILWLVIAGVDVWYIGKSDRYRNQ